MSDNIRDLQVEYWPIEKLTPYDKNAKNHPKDQVKKIAKSIKEHGWASSKAIEVDKDGVIINGHGRRLAALELKMKNVPVVVRDDLSDEQVKAYRLIDNRVSESSYDTELLAGELIDLKDLDYDMSDFFSEREFSFMMEDLGEINDDEITMSIGEEVESYSDATENAVKDQDRKQLPIHEAFGFRTVSGDQLRKLTLFRAHVEGVTGKTGPDALIEFAQDFVGVEL